MEPLRKWLWLKIVIGLSLISGLLLLVGSAKVVHVLVNVRWQFLMLIVLLVPITLSVTSLRWKILLRPFGILLPFSEVLTCYWIGMFVGNFMPTSIGGDLSRIALLKKYKLPAQVASSVILERLLGISVLILMAIVSLSFKPLTPKLQVALWSVLALLIGGLVCLVAVGRLGKAVLSSIDRERSKISNMIAFCLEKGLKVSQALLEYKDCKLQLLKGWFLSLLFYFLIALAHVIYLECLGLHVEIYNVFWAVPLISLISLLPLSFNGLGLAEGAFVVFYSQIGLTTQEAMALAVLARIMHILCSSFGGALLAFHSFGKK